MDSEVATELSDDFLIPPTHDPEKVRSRGWRPKLNPTQQKAFDSTSKYVLMYGEKYCRSLDTQIYLADGLCRLGNLKPSGSAPGTFSPLLVPVCAFDGSKVVTSTADAYWEESGWEAMKAILQHGGELTGSPRHPIWTCWESPDGAHGFDYRKLSEIAELKSNGWKFWTPLMAHPSWTKKALQYLVIRRTQEKCKVCGKPAVARGLCHVDYNRLVTGRGEIHGLDEEWKIPITPALAYSIGALVGDGSLNISTGDRRCASFTNADPECLEAVSLGLSEIGCSLVRSNTRTYNYNLLARKKVVRNFVCALKIDKLSYFKRIPDQIIESPKEVVCAFLSGLFDTDGTVEKLGLVSLCTVSENLSLDVQNVLAALGILCVRRPKKSASGRPTWTLSMMGRHAHLFGQIVGFKIKRKQDRIAKPKISFTTPNGFRHNRYSYPRIIRSVMKGIALGSRTGIRNKKVPVRFLEKHRRKGAVVWELTRIFPWNERATYVCVSSEIEARRQEAVFQEQLDQYYEQHHRSGEWHDKHRRLHSFGSTPSREKVNDFCELYACSDAVTQFMLSDHWLEIESVTPTQCELADLRVPGEESFLASGTINHNSGKSIGGLHSLVRHCYEEKEALALIIAPQIRTGKEGVLADLQWVLDIWRNGNWKDQANDIRADDGMGLDYTEPGMDAQTKDRVIFIGNVHGGWSKVIVISIPYPDVVSKRMKALSPSFVYADEMTELGGPEYFTYVAQQIGRRRNIVGVQQYYASTNPEGPSHWVYKVFFEDCVDKESGERDPNYAVFHVPVSENKHNAPPGYLETLKTLYRDPADRERLLKGRWVDRASGDAIFKLWFRPEIHIKPEPMSDEARRGEGLLPQKGFPVILGYDPGPVNFCVSFEQMIPTKEKALWIVFDELNYVGQYKPDFVVVPRILEKMNQWQTFLGSQTNFVHVTDNAAWTHMRPDGSYDATRIQQLSNGRIKLRGCPKGKESVPARVEMTNSMLADDRLFISNTCTKTHEMFRLLISEKAKEGKYDAKIGLRPVRSVYLHPFDAFSYPPFYFEINSSAFALQSQAQAVIGVHRAGERS